jgi:excisionase family DNA binding protein
VGIAFCSQVTNFKYDAMENVKRDTTSNATILFPYEADSFWKMMRQVIREEVVQVQSTKDQTPVYNIPGLTYKPLFKFAEVCAIFHVTKPTIYDWIRHGKLKPYKIRSRVYFLWDDIQKLIHPERNG